MQLANRGFDFHKSEFCEILPAREAWNVSSNAPKRIVIGYSVEGREIIAWEYRPMTGGTRTLLIGGMHGDEFATVDLLESYRTRVPRDSFVAVVPLVNPDGLARRVRYNANGVDLNRNCRFNWRADSDEPPGPEPWSEPESCALRDYIKAWKPAKIVCLHWALAEIDADGVQSTALAEAMWAAATEAERRPYRLRVTEPGRGQRRLEQTYVECPGSLGQWCGYALEYADGTPPAMITLELPADPGASRGEELPADHLPALHALWQRDAAGYLRAVEPGTFAMLDAVCRHEA